MNTFLLLMTIMTNENYQRGYGDGIAASKSASAAIHTVGFQSKKDCETVRAAFLNMRGLQKDRYDSKTNKVIGFELREGVNATCIKLSDK